MNSRSLKFRMTIAGVVVVVVPLVLLALVFLGQGNALSSKAKEELTQAGFDEMDAQVRLIAGNIEVAQQLLEKDVKKVIETADLILENRGGVVMDSDAPVSWDAINQFTRKSESVDLPALTLGDGTQIRPEKSFDQSVDIVDEVMDRTGDTATIFQRMNDAGDMLRVATNVNSGGVRAVGTFIPAVNPDGKKNPVVSQVLSGRDFVGRAFVVDQWYVTVYRPLFGEDGRVEGILYVGAPEKSATEPLINEFAEVKIGESGYVFVLNAQGKDQGRYILSGQRARDGEVILGLKDENGNEFVREMTENAKELKTGEIGYIRYPYKGVGDAVAKRKVVRYTYFPAWDWVIAVGSYEHEFYSQLDSIDAMLSNMNLIVMTICVGSGLVAGGVFLWLTGSVVRPIEGIISSIERGSAETTSAAGEVSSASQSLAEGASDQAASLEEAHASMETMNSLVDRNTEVARTTREETSTSNQNAREGVESMHSLLSSIQDSSKAVKSMGEVIAEIQESSNAVSKIIKTIDEIAFQTNILALNAAVEAARAGEAGAGFAVVADEVRSLAHRAAEAAGETASMIGESVQRSERGVEASDQVSSYLSTVEEGSVSANKLLEAIAESIQRINSSMETIETNSQDQHSGINQLTELVGHMNDVTQQNAASAEETASASEELNAQAMSLQTVVSDLSGIIYGAKAAEKRALEGDSSTAKALELVG